MECPQKADWAIFRTTDDAQAYYNRHAKPYAIATIIEKCGDHWHVKPIEGSPSNLPMNNKTQTIPPHIWTYVESLDLEVLQIADKNAYIILHPTGEVYLDSTVIWILRKKKS